MKFTENQILLAKKQSDDLINKSYHFSEKDKFYELCFCICSPQTKWKTNIEVNKLLMQEQFFSIQLSLEKIETIVKPLRFYKNKAKYLSKAFIDWNKIKNVIGSNEEKRQWLVNNISGLGYKTASMFLRNTCSARDLAIIDTHVLKYLEYKDVLSPIAYLKLEKKLKKQAEKLGIDILVLDALVFMSGSHATFLR